MKSAASMSPACSPAGPMPVESGKRKLRPSWKKLAVV